jgi:chromosome partitioning protein
MDKTNIEVLGVAELASLAGVSRQMVRNWQRHSKDMPKPVARLACGPIWDGKEIREWLVKIGYTTSENRERRRRA